MMATILLDSSVIFDHLNSKRGRSEYLDRLLAEGHLLATCSVNITEVYAGLRSGEEMMTRPFLDSLEFFAVTPDVARRAGLLRRDWREKGHTLSYTEVTIAAVALTNSLLLLTHNPKHFPIRETQLYPLPYVCP